MYIPKHFSVTDTDKIISFIKENAFGMLVTHRNGLFEATHLPIYLEENHEAITGHIAIANPQKEAIKQSEKALFIIQGPHTYISPTWYNHVNVPTWNYQAVHLHGQLHELTNEELHASLKRLVDKYEGNREPRFTLEQLPARNLEAQVRGVIGFRLKIERMECKFKLSQNRDNESYSNVIEALQREKSSGSSEIAEAMKRLR